MYRAAISGPPCQKRAREPEGRIEGEMRCKCKPSGKLAEGPWQWTDTRDKELDDHLPMLDAQDERTVFFILQIVIATVTGTSSVLVGELEFRANGPAFQIFALGTKTTANIITLNHKQEYTAMGIKMRTTK
ncbi:hypothetical protein ARMSODRAFT_981797 [Armillaria solidipes]|uniref:Uncharacterized protein n=1 Tax=Armillaria solidipes TaxID=1076256 RepID=A0A2H3AQL4_9AGAR|nr:hypothetical protein ARMSODRAFT_981797 [Armillaria solidipes]